MREILFRGRCEWRPGIVTWEKGNLIQRDGKSYIFTEDGETWTVQPETVSQYVGLQDKNGKKLFEGDIIEFSHEYRGTGYPTDIMSVIRVTDRAVWMICDIGGNAYYLDKKNQAYYKIIGNIWDDPELMERKNEKDFI